MATNPRTTVSDRTDLTLVRSNRKKQAKSSRTMARSLITTAIALAVLAAVLRYLPPASRNAQVEAGPVSVEALTDDLQLGSVQMSHAVTGEVLYLDSVVKYTGTIPVIGASVRVDFRDMQGQVVGSVQKPIVGMSHGGTDLIGNEFARNPIRPNEMRFFRVAIEQVPPAWNHEVPELKIVEVKVQ